jgi:hypothetical protein
MYDVLIVTGFSFVLILQCRFGRVRRSKGREVDAQGQAESRQKLAQVFDSVTFQSDDTSHCRARNPIECQMSTLPWHHKSCSDF